MSLWYGITSIAFGILLYFPLRKFMLSLAINRNQRKLNRNLTEEEIQKLRKKTYLIAAGVAITFAFIYNKIIMVRFIGGGAG